MSPILVVAPAASRRRFVNILHHAGYSVSEADCGETALEIALTVTPGLILMAIVMPQSNGLETAAKLRRIPELRSLPIILLGSVTPIGLNDEPLVSLVNGYLDFDASAGELLNTVDSQLAVNTR